MPIQADKHVKTATIFPIKKLGQKPADWMYTTIIIQICLGTIRDWLPVTYGSSRGLLNTFSPHQWIFETDASCCSPNKRTDGCESCCSYTRDLICMQICVAVYTISLFPPCSPPPSYFNVQIKYQEVLLCSSCQQQEWALNMWLFQSPHP